MKKKSLLPWATVGLRVENLQQVKKPYGRLLEKMLNFDMFYNCGSAGASTEPFAENFDWFEVIVLCRSRVFAVYSR